MGIATFMNQKVYQPKIRSEKEDFHSQMARDSELREQQVVCENKLLKQSLHDVLMELQNMLSQNEGKPVDIPFEHVQESIEQKIRVCLQELRETSSSSSLDLTISEQNRKIEYQEMLLEQQEQRLDELGQHLDSLFNSIDNLEQ